MGHFSFILIMFQWANFCRDLVGLHARYLGVGCEAISRPGSPVPFLSILPSLPPSHVRMSPAFSLSHRSNPPPLLSRGEIRSTPRRIASFLHIRFQSYVVGRRRRGGKYEKKITREFGLLFSLTPLCLRHHLCVVVEKERDGGRKSAEKKIILRAPFS